MTCQRHENLLAFWTAEDPTFMRENREEKTEKWKSFHEALWNEGKWEQKPVCAPEDITAVEHGRGSGRQKTGTGEWDRGGLGARVAFVGSQVPVQADVHLASGSLGNIWVWGFRLEKHLVGCELPVATSFFPHLQPGQAVSSRTAAWLTVMVEGIPDASSPRSVNFSKVQACRGSTARNSEIT